MWEPTDIKYHSRSPQPPQELYTPPQSAFGAAFSFAYPSEFASAYNRVYFQSFNAAFQYASAPVFASASDPDPDPDPAPLANPDPAPLANPDPARLANPASARTPITDPSSISFVPCPGFAYFSLTFPRPVPVPDTLFASYPALVPAFVYADTVANSQALKHARDHAFPVALTYAERFAPRALQTSPLPEDDVETPPGTPPNPLAGPRLPRELPDDVWRRVFSRLLERDLCRVSQVCRRFARIANDPELWRRLYEDLYEYDRPLINPAPCHFQFCTRELSGDVNPWRESFRRLYEGVHVRPGFRAKALPGRSVVYFDSVHGALAACHRSLCASADPQRHMVVFVHPGTYREPPLVVRANVALIGAAPSSEKTVTIECKTGTTLRFAHGAVMAYVGYLTLKLSPPQASFALHLACLEVSGNSSPTIEHCTIRSSFAISPAVRVRGPNAHPDIRYCVITDCQNVGLCMENKTEGIIEGNLMNKDLCKQYPYEDIET